MGALMVPLPYLLRAQIGRVGAFAAAALLAFGPCYLYFSRFAREDIYFAAISLALLVVAFRFLERPRRHQPALIGALLALAFATKETTFITGFVAFTFFAGVLLFRRELLLRPLRAVGLEAWGWGLAPPSSASTRCSSPPSSRTPTACAGSTPASTTGSASTRSAAAARPGTSTSSSCSATSGRRCCSGPWEPCSRSGGRRSCACS